MLHVKSVEKGSLAEELGLEPGTQLLSVNGRKLLDFLDWEFQTADETFDLMVRLPSGELVEFDVERPEDLPLGVELEPPKVRSCANRCEFCFVGGNPKGLRKALYLRDDDYRLSFRYGNFVTLTNLKQKDFDRILEYCLSPLYVSVHATDVRVRRELLGNPRAPDVLEQFRALGEGGIQCHTQIVLRPGVNDGAELARTLEDLYGMGETVLSVAVVPVGLTRCNEQPPRRAPNRDECRDAIATLDSYAERAGAERDRFWVYGSDELYIIAGRPLPPFARYDEFDQLENGVGGVRLLQSKLEGFSADLSGKTIGLLTGTAMAPFFPEIVSTLEAGTGARFELIVSENELFGPSVTTAGLLPGRAFANALSGWQNLDLALIPAEAINEDGVFLDEMAFSELVQANSMEIRASYWLVDAFGIGH
jgi:putative radical SAM enzyme (TIGR03279 family)